MTSETANHTAAAAAAAAAAGGGRRARKRTTVVERVVRLAARRGAARSGRHQSAAGLDGASSLRRSVVRSFWASIDRFARRRRRRQRGGDRRGDGARCRSASTITRCLLADGSSAAPRWAAATHKWGRVACQPGPACPPVRPGVGPTVIRQPSAV